MAVPAGLRSSPLLPLSWPSPRFVHPPAGWHRSPWPLLQRRCCHGAAVCLAVADGGGGGGGWAQVLLQAGLPLLQWTLTSMGAYIAAAWPDRPRGWCRQDLIEVRESPVAGLGVFAKASLPEGAVLGAYPGRPRSADQMAAKISWAPAAAGYCFQTHGGWLLDPTDRAGQPSAYPAPGLVWLPVDPALARVNEPPAGSGGPNVEVQDDPKDERGLLFVTSQPIEAGQELWIDYGRVYDRSAYSRAGEQ